MADRKNKSGKNIDETKTGKKKTAEKKLEKKKAAPPAPAKKTRKVDAKKMPVSGKPIKSKIDGAYPTEDFSEELKKRLHEEHEAEEWFQEMLKIKKEKNSTPQKDKKQKKLPVIQEAGEKDEEEIDPVALSRGDRPMGIIDHLNEFRSRLMSIVLSLLIGTIVGFVFSDELMAVINKPFLDSGLKLNIFKLTGGFMFRMKVSLISAFLVTLPLLIIQLWRFISPAIDKKNKNFARISIFFALLLFYSGVGFVFLLLLPFAIPVMLEFIGKDMMTTIGADDYLSFATWFSFGMGLLFELPIVIMILTKIGLITPMTLTGKRKHAIVIIWIIAAIITPQPDIISQSLVAVPLMILYEISIIISRIIYKKKLKNESAD